MNFGQAIEALKEGKKVAREGWNGRGMCVFEMKVTGIEVRGAMPDNRGIRPCFAMLDVQQMIVPGWLASQTDMRAEDWRLVE